MDQLSPADRSALMSRVKGKDTRPELLVRKHLHAKGFRYRLGGCGLPGRPDLVLSKHRTVVFVHGCFWHRHPGCALARTPKSRVEFWTTKLDANKARDARVQRELAALGWHVIVVWECALKGAKQRVTDNLDRLSWMVQNRINGEI